MTRARFRSTHPTDTQATGPAGIAGDERHIARGKGHRNIARRATRAAALAMAAGTAAGMTAVGVTAVSADATSSPWANRVQAYAGALGVGPAPGTPFHAAMRGIAATPTKRGYWLTASDGGVFSYGDARYEGSTGALRLVQPVVAIAASPKGWGYWLAASDGGVFSFGDAHYNGSAAPFHPVAPIVGIAPTPSGRGYFLAGADGGVFAFGDAHFRGSAAPFHPVSPIVGIAATPTGRGYWLLSSDGGVFAFGDAPYHGSLFGSAPGNDAVAITASQFGYLIARRTGAVASFGTDGIVGATDALDWVNAPTVGIAASSKGFWTVQGAPIVDHLDAFLTCTRSHESSHTAPYYDDGYNAVNPSGTYFGAYQFDQQTWNSAAGVAGRSDLIGVNPAAASVADQDLLAMTLFHERGAQPWLGRCAGLS